MTTLHPTAVIAEGACLGAGVDVGPYCVVGSDTRLGDGVRLMAHVVVDGVTDIGADCTVYPFASIGTRTQDLKFAGGSPRVEIGPRTTIREYVTVNSGTADGQVTSVGAGCLLMAGCHVAHNCRLGDGVIMANGSGLAGDVIIEDGAVLGGLCGVHQFVRIGRNSFCGGCSKIVKDVPPFMLVDGNPSRVYGLNRVGLKRRGMTDETITILKRAFRVLYRDGLTLERALTKIQSQWGDNAEVAELVLFARNSQRGIIRPGTT